MLAKQGYDPKRAPSRSDSNVRAFLFLSLATKWLYDPLTEDLSVIRKLN